jgi:hypothetical protein
MKLLKVNKNDNFFGSDFEFCTISLLVMLNIKILQKYLRNFFLEAHKTTQAEPNRGFINVFLYNRFDELYLEQLHRNLVRVQQIVQPFPGEGSVLKGLKHEIFEHGLLTQIRPVRVVT